MVGNKNGAENKMKTLIIANQKGGVGKTSSVVHMAFDLMERGKKVVVIDLDPQANASYSLNNFDSGYSSSQLYVSGVNVVRHFTNIEPGIYLIHSDAELANMDKKTLGDAAQCFHNSIQALDTCGFDVCLIDTPPSLGINMAAPLFSADYVISPIELEAYSIHGIKKMFNTIGNVKKHNTKLKFLGMIPSKVDSRNPRHIKHYSELEKAYPQLIIPQKIGLRSSVADALASQVPVWKIKKTAARKAVKEIRALNEYVFKKMEIE